MTERLIIRAAQVESDGQKSWLESLSDRELEVFEWLGHGLTSAEIARQMNLKQKTVETYREKIKRKLGLQNGNQLIQHAVKWVLEHDRS
jgi:DNA-binding CsgD family transcriptional regulator